MADESCECDEKTLTSYNDTVWQREKLKNVATEFFTVEIIAVGEHDISRLMNQTA